jgi:hypothetical protein
MSANETFTHQPEIPFHGHRFSIGDKVMFVDPIYSGYDKYPELEGYDVVNGHFTVADTESVHRPSTGEHDDISDYDYQRVELTELPGWKFANDRIKPAEQSKPSE